MKVLERSAERLVLGMGPQEKIVLERLLAFFPLGPDREPMLSKGGLSGGEGAQELLREALREDRVELQEWLRRHLEGGTSLRRVGSGWSLALGMSDVDRLLRVLNELRVGAWTRLGCPEELHEEPSGAKPGEAPFFVIMTLAGQFEMVLIQALGPGGAPVTSQEPGKGE